MSRKLGFGLIGGGLSLVVAAALAVVLSGGDTVGRPELVEQQIRSTDQAVPLPKSPSAAATGAAQDRPPAGNAAPSPATAANEAAPAVVATEPPSGQRSPAPVGLRIGALAIDAPVAPYGVEEGTRQMAVPNNVTDVAWYKYGPSPGESGSAVLAAHVDLHDQGRGVFFELRDLEVDDLVNVDYADGSERSFRVVARTVYEKEELPTDVIFAKSGPPVLTLITCGGGFSRSDRSYDSNVVVYAVPSTDDLVPAPGSAG